MNVTVRVPAELYDEFQDAFTSNDTTITSVLVEHINNQVKNYRIPNQAPKNNDKDYDNYSYKKANFRIDSDLYALYKIELIKNRTTPTADIIRLMREIVGRKK